MPKQNLIYTILVSNDWEFFNLFPFLNGYLLNQPLSSKCLPLYQPLKLEHDNRNTAKETYVGTFKGRVGPRRGAHPTLWRDPFKYVNRLYQQWFKLQSNWLKKNNPYIFQYLIFFLKSLREPRIGLQTNAFNHQFRCTVLPDCDTVTYLGDPSRLHWIPTDGAQMNVYLYAWPQATSGECVIDIIWKRRKSSPWKPASIYLHNILPQGVKTITKSEGTAIRLVTPPGSSITAAHLKFEHSKWIHIL